MDQINKTEPNQIFSAIREEAEKRKKEFREDPRPKIHIGVATCGIASGALETKNAFEEALTNRNIEARIHTVGCIGIGIISSEVHGQGHLPVVQVFGATQVGRMLGMVGQETAIATCGPKNG